MLHFTYRTDAEPVDHHIVCEEIDTTRLASDHVVRFVHPEGSERPVVQITVNYLLDEDTGAQLYAYPLRGA